MKHSHITITWVSCIQKSVTYPSCDCTWHPAKRGDIIILSHLKKAINVVLYFDFSIVLWYDMLPTQAGF